MYMEGFWKTKSFFPTFFLKKKIVFGIGVA